MKLLAKWPHKRLGDISKKIGSGSTPRGGDSVYRSEGAAIIRSQNVYNGLFNYEGLARLSEEHADQLTGVTVEAGDVLLNITGDSVARCCQAPESVIPARVNQHVTIIRPNSKILNPQFLCYYLISPLMQSYLLSIAGSGGTRKALTKAMIEEFHVPCPSLQEQNQIVEIVGAYDDLIENNRRRMALLEESARLLYQEWFVRLRFPGHEHVRVIDGLPEGWDRKPFKEFCPDLRDAAHPADLEPGTPYIGLEHIPRRSITLLEWGTVGEVTSTKIRYRAGDILFGKIRPYFHKVGFAITDGVASSDAIVLRPIDPAYYSFSLLTVSSDWFVTIVSKTAKEGSKMPRADWNLMETHLLAVPPLGILESLNETVRPMLDQLRTLAFQNQKLRAARDLLLPRLMSGEVDV